MDEITKKAYRDEVNALAAECVRQAKEEGSELTDVVWQNVDGHQWVIYTAYHHQVLHHTDTDPAERIADMGGLDLSKGWDNAVMQAAFLALEGDVMERAQALYDETPEKTP